eukprot:911568-Ditylum_brightwellii.AAC.1
MATNYICSTIYKQAVNSLCCLCSKWNETILHIANGHDMLQGTKYTERHNKVCTYLHWCILKYVQQPVVPNWHQHKEVETASICLKDSRTLMYNMKQHIDPDVATNCPDIVLLNEKKMTALLIDVTCPMDVNMISAAAMKHKTYCNLEIVMKKQFHLRKIQTVPIVIGALGTISQNFDTNLAKLSPQACAATIQKEVLLGMAHILRHVLMDTVL